MSSNEGWSHEFRIQSNYDGNLNFLLGGMMLDYESRNRYVVRNAGLSFPDKFCLSTQQYSLHQQTLLTRTTKLTHTCGATK